MKPRVVFFQQYPVPYFGILALDQHLRCAGFQAEVVIDLLEKDPISVIQKMAPSLIGISVLSSEHPWLIRMSKELKKALPQTKIIVGGFHGMLYSKEILEETPVDFVCHGDGEEVLIRVVEAMGLPESRWESIAGIAYRDNGKICFNEAAPLVSFREEIVEDRNIYYRRYPKLAQDTDHCFISSRGCPYRCSFCYNAHLRERFKEKGTFIRQKSVDNFIKEIVLDCSHHPVESIFLFDDLFTLNEKWLYSFLERYKKEVNLPFICMTKANLINEEMVIRLAEAGSRTVVIGIETGSNFIRQNILKKSITNEEIVRCGQLLQKHGIKMQTNNMFCLPGETLEDAFKTVELNIQAKTQYAFASIFLPFPKTELTDYCIQNGILKQDYSLKDIPHSTQAASVLNLGDKGSITNVQRACFFFVRWPWTFKLFRQLVKVAFLDPFFKVLSIIGHFVRHKEQRGISFWAMVRYAWRLRKAF